VATRLESYEILLGVCGGIAAYKTADLCSKLIREQAGVTVAMTEPAQQFVSPLTFSTLSGRRVYTDLFNEEQVYEAEHIALTHRADLIVVAPATTNILAKLATGICDDMLSTLLCSAESDVLLAPAMNQRMWEHPATQDNVKKLQQWGCHFVGPATGRLACGDEGVGRMAEPNEILERIVELATKKPPKQIGK
jgi:phosphopantothenoylcysteine decarboxylase/phosphopantothenate--cysteine ligase